MNHDAYFRGELARLKDEGKYRVFADLTRERGALSQGPEPPR